MMDLHSHILPGVDDGPGELNEALEMAESAVAAGIRLVVATPHAFRGLLDVSPAARDASLTRLRHALHQHRIPLCVEPGFECLVVNDLPERIQAEPAYLYPPPAAGTLVPERSVLIELTEDLPVTCLAEILFRLRMLHITPVLAHPERHPDIRRRPDCIEDFVRHGGKLQITAPGLLGEAGWRERRLCEKLLRRDLVHMLATDAHTPEEAGTLGKALQRAVKLVGSRAEALVGGE